MGFFEELMPNGTIRKIPSRDKETGKKNRWRDRAGYVSKGERFVGVTI